ncbi:hypothetical protein Ahu01nite_095590 [Winogradskya humida]|uniref:Uncharacterized protein n=1 Tax=Winogradskya humida TaxID=113566 RepID=A0ABQ4A6G6_9ACTN|nr:hypothetical protein Ahu01nite_095590 [Actinoplanes humidus]
MPQGQRGEVEHRVAVAGLGPVEHAGDPVLIGEDVGDLEVAVDERRGERAEGCPGDLAVAGDQTGGEAGDGSPRTPRAWPGRAPSAITDGWRHRIGAVGTGAAAIASASASRRAGSPSTLRKTSPTRSVTRSE